MSWLNNLGSTVRSLQTQITDITAEVLQDATEEIDDPVAQAQVYKRRCEELGAHVTNLTAQLQAVGNERDELHERLMAAEMHMQSANTSQDELRKKNEVIEVLKAENDALKQTVMARRAANDDTGASSSTNPAHMVSVGNSDSNDDWQHFDDRTPPLSPVAVDVQKDFELHRLRDELKHLRTEIDYWKQIAVSEPAEQQALSKKADGSISRTEFDEAVAKLKHNHFEHVCEVKREYEEKIAAMQDEMRIVESTHPSQSQPGSRQSVPVTLSATGGGGAPASDDSWAHENWSDELTTGTTADEEVEKADAATVTAADLDGERDDAMLEELKVVNEDYRVRNNELQTMLDVEKNKVTECQARILEQETSFTARIKELEESLDSLDAQNVEAMEKVLGDKRELQTKFSELSNSAMAEASTLGDAVKTLDAELSEERTANDNLRQERDSLAARLESCERELDSKACELVNLRIASDQNEQCVVMLTEKIEQLGLVANEAVTSHAQDDVLKAELAALRSEISETRDMRNQLDDSIRSLSEQVIDVKLEKEELIAERDDLKCRLDEALTTFGSVTADVAGKSNNSDSPNDLEKFRSLCNQYQLWIDRYRLTVGENAAKIIEAEWEKEIGPGSRPAELDLALSTAGLAGGLQRDLDAVKGSLDETVSALDDKTAECNRLAEECIARKGELDERDELLQQALSELKTTENLLAECRARENSARAELVAETQRLSMQVASLSEDLQRAAVQNSEQEEKLRGVYAYTGEQDMSLHEKIRQLEEQNDVYCQELSRTCEQGCNERRLTAEKDAALQAANEELQKIKQGMADFNLQITTPEMSSRDERIRELEQQNETYCQEISRASERCLSERQLVAERDAALQAANEELQKIKQGMADSNSQMATLEMSSRDERIRELEQQYETYCQEISRASEQCLSERQLVAEKDYALQAANGELQKMKQELIDWNSQIATLQSERDQLVELVNSKHEESVRLHAEAQRQASLAANEKAERVQFQRKLDELQKTLEVERASATETREQLQTQVVSLKAGLQELQAAQSSVANNSSRLEELATSLARAQDLQQNAERDRNRAAAERDAEKSRADELTAKYQTEVDLRQKCEKEVDRLRGHLVQLEETYTRDALAAENRETELLSKVRQLESLTESSNETLVEKDKFRADLLNQLQSAAAEKAALTQELDRVRDELDTSERALTSLQDVLQSMQQEQDGDRRAESLRVNSVTTEFRKQIDTLQVSLKETREQLAASESSRGTLENEASTAKERLAATEDELNEVRRRLHQFREGSAQSRINDPALVDKEILKNLFMGYFTSPDDKKKEIAHLIGSVLGFSNEMRPGMRPSALELPTFEARPAASGSGDSTSEFLKEALQD